jgi:hypothetical protein
MATRTAYIVQDVLRLVGDQTARKFTRSAVVRVLRQVQEDLCRETLAIKFEGTLSLVAGKEVYDVNGKVDKIVELIEPAAWKHELQVLHNVNDWKRVRRDTTLGSEQPLYVWLWDRWMHLWPLPAAAESLGIIGSALPELVLTEATEPEVNARWDEALKYGTVARLDPGLLADDGVSYATKYKMEISSVGSREIKESIAGNLTRKHWSALGF